ncbi:ribosomal protein S6 [Gloeothece citriformis PCC 7424]|uniref:Small ribosomal subunit protein bS6 n=1 Tax=Gloeothece citriformis (strain PCC 7424) TaxID=65393 RepID=RS6_GLOC7|nr:RecName: Full=Small ribosomal subunit protein bS6; AltName: Full=30S ribosomal protein S6 [Gloeothece citriformis PCC 7424]ACK73163.1 ribosomal protein S6 [Gloeothece citriformis PCC 7424]
MTKSYEMVYILRPDLLEEQVQQEINRYRDFLTENEAQEVQIKYWGKRRLAYPIKKLQDGFYVQMNYQGDGKQIAPLERMMRLSDEVIRYLTIKLDKDQYTPNDSPPPEGIIDTPKPVIEPPKPAVESPKPAETTEETAEAVETVEPPAEPAEPVEAVETVDTTEETVEPVDTTSEE